MTIDDPYLVRISRRGEEYDVSLGSGPLSVPVTTTRGGFRQARRIGLIASAVQWRADGHHQEWAPSWVDATSESAQPPTVAITAWVDEASFHVDTALDDGVRAHLEALAKHVDAIDAAFTANGGQALSVSTLRSAATHAGLPSLLFVLDRLGLASVDGSNDQALIPAAPSRLVTRWASVLHPWRRAEPEE